MQAWVEWHRPLPVVALADPWLSRDGADRLAVALSLGRRDQDLELGYDCVRVLLVMNNGVLRMHVCVVVWCGVMYLGNVALVCPTSACWAAYNKPVCGYCVLCSVAVAVSSASPLPLATI
jgi:hypothetical protein